MASSAPAPLRQILENRVTQLLDEAERLCAEARGRAQREMADQLNQAARRVCQASAPDELAATLAAAAAQFAAAALVFRVDGDSARSEKIELPLAAAPALAGAVQTRDPVTAAAIPSEVSSALVDLLGHSPEDRVSVFPLVVRGQVPALLYCWGSVQPASVELLAQVAAAVWSALVPPAPLVAIAPAPAAAPEPASAWDKLSPEDQRTHLRAQRFARVKIAELRLFESAGVQSGRTHHNLYDALRNPIDAAREAFRAEFFASCSTMVDYLHLELLRILANDDAELLGNDYPGPMV
jgi:hypothetical protein